MKWILAWQQQFPSQDHWLDSSPSLNCDKSTRDCLIYSTRMAMSNEWRKHQVSSCLFTCRSKMQLKKSWKIMYISTNLIHGIRPKAFPFHKVPYPLHQEPPPIHPLFSQGFHTHCTRNLLPFIPFFHRGSIPAAASIFFFFLKKERMWERYNTAAFI